MGTLDAQLRGDKRLSFTLCRRPSWLGWMTERGLFQLLDDGQAAVARHLEGMTAVICRTFYEGPRPTR